MFTKKRGWEGELTLNNTIIPLKNQVKYLGIILDKNLTWKAHCDWKYSSCSALLMACRRAVGRTWGLKPSVTRWIYTAIIRPMLSYGASIWLPAILRQGRVADLTKIQRLGCLMVSSAYHTTPTVAMEKLLNLPPIDIFLAQTALEQATRMMQDGMWRGKIIPGHHQSHERLIQDFMNSIPNINLPSDGTRNVNIEKQK